MIYLNQNQTNLVTVSLQDNSQLFIYSGIQPYYLWILSSQTTNSQVKFVADNIAPTSARTSYDQFNFICTGASFTNLSAGTIHLNPSQQWHYSVFEQTQQYNFALSGTTNLVKQGKVLYSAATQDFKYQSMTGNTGYIVFNTYG